VEVAAVFLAVASVLYWYYRLLPSVTAIAARMVIIPAFMTVFAPTADHGDCETGFPFLRVHP